MRRSNPLYYWGQYEQSIYQSYTKPGKVTPSVLAQRLEEDLEKAASQNLKPNPGLHAQLGVLYFNMGRMEDSRRQFETEKTLFPESAVLMDRLLARFAEPQSPVAP